MAQNYVLVARKNPLRPDENARFYAQAISDKKIDVNNICKRISERSSYSQGELEGCIGEFLIELQHVLEEGNIAQMGRLGNFRLTVKSKEGTATTQEFKGANIKSCHVRFSPSAQLKAMCKSMTYALYRKEKEKEEVEQEED